MFLFYAYWGALSILEVKVSLFVVKKKDLSEKQIILNNIDFLGQINNDDPNGKQIGPQCVLVGLCLVLFHSV